MHELYYFLWKRWLKISSIGCKGEITNSTIRKLMLTNQTAVVVGLLSSIYIYVFRHDLILMACIVAFMMACVLVLILNYNGYVNRSRFLMSIAPPTVIYVMGGILSSNLAGFSPTVMLLSVLGIPLVLFGLKEYKRPLICLAIIIFYYYSFEYFSTYLAIDNLAISYVNRSLYLSSSVVGIAYFVFAFIHLKLINKEYEERLTINVKKLSTKTALLAMREERLKKLTEELQASTETAIQKGRELKFVNGRLQESIDKVKDSERALNKQLELVAEKKKEITDSIEYAFNIQQAILPKSDALHQYFENSFLLYKPKDIVSGDFMFVHEKDDQVVVAACDCTGHGVPGAMMTIIGHSQLGEIVEQMEELDSLKILELLDRKVIEILRQKGDHPQESQDGMDLSLIVYDKKTKRIQFSGANRPLYIIRGGELEKYNSANLPIGGTQFEEKVYSKTEIQLVTGDQLYLFSDGYPDQFGGERGKKFMIKRFVNTLIEINHLPLLEQRNRLDFTFEDWKGFEEQVDDILVMSIKID